MSADRVKELEQALRSARTVIIGLATPLTGNMSPEIAARLDEWALLLKGPEGHPRDADGDGAAGVGWSPIASAPKDGTIVLVWLNVPSNFRGPVVVPAFWCDEEDGLVTAYQFHKRIWVGTHWRPLPEPPSLEVRRERA